MISWSCSSLSGLTGHICGGDWVALSNRTAGVNISADTCAYRTSGAAWRTWVDRRLRNPIYGTTTSASGLEFYIYIWLSPHWYHCLSFKNSKSKLRIQPIPVPFLKFKTNSDTVAEKYFGNLLNFKYKYA